MEWDFPQETIEFMKFDSDNLLEKLSSESLSDEEFIKITNFIFDLDDKHPTYLSGLCRRLIISLASEKLKNNSQK